MPTALKPQHPLKRETGVVYRGRPLLIELHPGWLTLREKGRRHSVVVEYRAVLDLGFKLLARQAMAEKKARKGQ